MQIVVVEDEAPIRNGLSTIINKLNPNWQVIDKAENGLRGLDVILKRKPDVVMMDIMMPDMNGLDMIEQARRSGYTGEAVVISAYSDFSYAKRAMELGVDHYILKPVRMEELNRVLQNLEDSLAKKNRLTANWTLANYFTAALLGQYEMNAQVEEDFLANSELFTKEPVGCFQIYLGDMFERYSEVVISLMTSVVEHASQFRGEVIPFPDWQRVCVVFYNMESATETEDYLERRVVPMLQSNTDHNAVCLWRTVKSYHSLREALLESDRDRVWALSLREQLISERTLAALEAEPLRLQANIQARLRRAAEQRNRQDLEGIYQEVRTTCQNGCYLPKSIRANLVNVFWLVVSTAREFGYSEQQEELYHDYLEELLDVCCFREAGIVLGHLFDQVCVKTEATAQRENYSRLVRQAGRLIDKNYSQGFNLEEAAEVLSVTPEYLSRQFKKETGISFTEALRRVRMEKVRFLLVCSKMNMSQIAAAAGFSDSKYMARVFREEMGMTPAEYRSGKGQLH